MANEINIQAAFTVQRYSPALQGVGSLNISQTGTRCIANVVNVATDGNATLQIEGSTSINYLFVKNLSTGAWNQTNYVALATDNASPPVQIFARLRAGEFCLIPVKPAAAYYARASGVAADICYVAAQE